jgi:hypothetical protein
MLRMRLSLDCGCVAVATQGVSDNLFTVESLSAVGTAAECPGVECAVLSERNLRGCIAGQ